jgi:hypothetical protein
MKQVSMQVGPLELRKTINHQCLQGDHPLNIAHHFPAGEVAVAVPDFGGSYDLYSDDTCDEFLGNVCSISEATRLLSDQEDQE